MSEKKLIVILLDAFRADYVDAGNTPFLYSLAQSHGMSLVKPSYGFCERTEILHGQDSKKSGLFTAIGLKRNLSWYRKLILRMSPVFKFRQSFSIFRKITNKVSNYFGLRIPIYLIPLELLGLWKFTEDSQDITDPFIYNDGFLYNNRAKKMSFKHFTSLGNSALIKNDKERLIAAIRELNTNDVVFVYVGNTDWLGHVLGPDSHGFREYLNVLDSDLKNAYEMYEHEDVETIFLGDHGMITVENVIDIESKLSLELGKLGYRRLRDYFYFIDSTVVRVYFIRRARIEDINLEEFIAEFNLSLVTNVDKQYGDIIIGCRPGQMFFPNYFNSSVLKGMHGYDSDAPQNMGMKISDKKSPKSDIINLHEVLQ